MTGCVIQTWSNTHLEVLISLDPGGDRSHTLGVTHLSAHEHRGHSELFPRDVAIVNVPLRHTVVPTGYHYREYFSMVGITSTLEL